MPAEYVFAAGGDACEVCMDLEGSEFIAPAHPNCRCQCVPGEPVCTFEYHGGSSYFSGPNNEVVSFVSEINVTCPDGSEIGQTLAIDISGLEALDDPLFDYINDEVDAAASELCAECPESESDSSDLVC